MAYVIVFLFITLDVFIFVHYKNIYNPSFVFCSFWTLIVLLSSFRLLGEDPTSDLTYIIIFVGSLFFAIGSGAIGNKILKVKTGHSTENFARSNGSQANLTIFYLVAIFAVIYSTSILIKTLPLLLSGTSIATIRSYYLVTGSSDLLMSDAKAYFVQNVLFQTAQTVCLVVGVTEFFRSKKWLPLLIALYITLVSGLTYGNRMAFIDLAEYIFFGFVILRKYQKFDRIKKLAKRQKLIITILTITILGVLIYITGIRQTDVGIWTALYNDYTCSVRLLDICLQQVWNNGDMTFGMITIRGLFEPIIAILGSSYFGSILSLPAAYSTLGNYTNVFFNIGSGQMNNAYVSSFFYFYLDGGIVGLVVLSVIYGMFAKNFYNRMKKSQFNNFDFCLYLLIINSLLRSFMRFQFSTTDYAWGAILIYIIYHTRSKGIFGITKIRP